MLTDLCSMIRVALMGSGQGTIARGVVLHARSTNDFAVELLVTTSRMSSTRAGASGFPDIGREFGISCSVLAYSADALDDFSSSLISLLRNRQIDLLALVGFTRLLPAPVIVAMQGQVINTHPGPLPEFGGRGMYGLHVHRAVLEAGRPDTEITIHWVSDRYDEGAVIATQSVAVRPDDTAETLQARVKAIEAPFVAQTISALVRSRMLDR